MKQPKTQDLSQVQPNDNFSQKVAEVKADNGKTQPKTFSLVKSDIDYINAKSLALSQEAGQNVSASKALSVIINEHRANKGAK